MCAGRYTYTLVSVPVISSVEQRGNPWLNCFPFCESMSSEVVSEDGAICWRGVGGGGGGGGVE